MAGFARTFLPFGGGVLARSGASARILEPVRTAQTPSTALRRYHRTIFISDVHLGTRGCKAELLVDFLSKNTCSTLYLVGDIIDGWQLKRRWFWTETQERVLTEIFRKADEGARVIYIPGNHDEVFRRYCERRFAGIECLAEAVHETADGRRLLVTHGDQMDGVIACAKWLAHLGDWAYVNALRLNGMLHILRRAMGLPYWSLSAYLKNKVKNAVSYIASFEAAVAHEVKRRGLDGVVCGHIHHAAIRTIDGVLYLNDGDWVESCTALVEDAGGTLEILRWAELASVRSPEPAAAQEILVPA
jgi:UDP-2,3-diacylglucosamine pyrophosphatase LpxH